MPKTKPPEVRTCGSQKYLKSNIAKVNKKTLKIHPKNVVTLKGCWL